MGDDIAQAQFLIANPTAVANKHDAIHRWVPWIAGFSAAFVRAALHRWAPSNHGRLTILDPFAGVGTTLVESARHGHNAVGIELNPFAALASRVKCSAFQIEPEDLQSVINAFDAAVREPFARIDEACARGDDLARCTPAPTSRPPMAFRSRIPFFSPAIERKILHCLDFIDSVADERLNALLTVALGSLLVAVSNYSYEPSLSSRAAAGKPSPHNADVAGLFLAKLATMLNDITHVRQDMARFAPPPQARVLQGDARWMLPTIQDESIDLVITSPPYLNNYHYARNTRPLLYWLRLIEHPHATRELERLNFGASWQAMRRAPPQDLLTDIPFVQRLVHAIAEQEARQRPSSARRGWANYAVAYFNDCVFLCREIQRVLKRRAHAVVVLGNSILQGVNVPTDEAFGCISEAHGLIVADRLDLRRKRTGASVVVAPSRCRPTSDAVLYETALVLRKG